jgi:hypothetical protein
VAAEKIGSALIADNAGLEERKKLFEQDRHNLLNSYKLEIELIGNKTLNQIQSISAIAQIRQTSCKRL